MLRELVLENFVLIERAEVLFGPGFTVITGDTGAGKSLLIKAFKMLLGARGESKIIGNKAKKASIQAVFDAGDWARAFLDKRGIECESELIIRRVISTDGRNRVFINGAISTLSDLRVLSSHLISLAGQHEFQRLLSHEIHRRWLDDFAGISVAGLSSKLGELKELRDKLSAFIEKQSKLEEQRGEFVQNKKVIDQVAPNPLEEDKLIQERRLLRESEKLRNIGQELYQRLYAGRQSILEGLSDCSKLIEKLCAVDPALESLSAQMDSILSEADDVAASIRDYLYGLPMDDSRLRQVEERLFELRSLKKRFGPSIEDVLRYREEIEKELSQMENLHEEIGRLKGLVKKKEDEALKEAREISRKRKWAAESFQAEIQAQLGDLDLSRARFQVDVRSPSEPSITDVGLHGMDRVTFLFSANPGRELQPLSEVASGGELSRLLLAIKVVMGERQGSETLVFDEIDSGIGGEVAEKVGRKLAAIAEKGQVIAISHFPQIAALAQRHVVVRKEQGEEETVSTVFQVDQQERVDEIARMLGGDSGKAREYAKELLGTVFRGA